MKAMSAATPVASANERDGMMKLPNRTVPE
jgi:hypothetical protein